MGNEQRPYLLISNDDGYSAKGIRVLVEALRHDYDLLVVAPEGPRSGKSCAITAGKPFTLRLVTDEPHLKVYACSGTPVDCVKLALNRLAERRPDLVIGGINHGDNASVNAHYSGTMGVATEGALQGLPAVAFSLCDMHPNADFSATPPYLAEVVRRTLAAELPPFTCLNVNFPATKELRGIRVCRMAKSRWVNEIEDCPRTDDGLLQFRLGGECRELEPEAEDTDRWALAHGYVSLTPQTLDTTDYQLYEVLSDSWRGER